MGRPDGATVDSEGNYWSAQYAGSRVLCISPQGELLHEIMLPVTNPTMPCFGGPDLKTLYVTSASQGMSAEHLAAHPLEGAVLAIPMDVAGLPEVAFAG
jgi:sugar lactone lactonase YvrE